MTVTLEPTIADAMREASQVIAHLDLFVESGLVGDGFWAAYRFAVKMHREDVAGCLRDTRPSASTWPLLRAELAVCDAVLFAGDVGSALAGLCPVDGAAPA